VSGLKKIEDENRESENKEDCVHEWKAIETKYMGSQLEPVCVKCGGRRNFFKHFLNKEKLTIRVFGEDKSEGSLLLETHHHLPKRVLLLMVASGVT